LPTGNDAIETDATSLLAGSLGSSTAKMFEVNTMNGSRVTPKIAGMESMANTRSVNSTSTRTSSTIANAKTGTDANRR